MCNPPRYLYTPVTTPSGSKRLYMGRVTIAKNILGLLECPIEDSRGNWQTPRWPLNSYRKRPVNGNYHLWIPLGRFVDYQKIPTIDETLMDSASGRLVFDLERMESVYVPEKKGRKETKKRPDTKHLSVHGTTKNVVSRSPFNPREVNTLPFPSHEEHAQSTHQ
ncbi:hypothetical protein NEOLEDRAFT_1141882 [Neolentinus lepideus HHB14362 ss-1]|uniref:Uncharacterized protein n=1 Tax=Neolentinus lepideus HHB14362 ss-1 TaxID=1314782 RepID=A0A165NEY2_9AGAM|nr:hypothetical protein NEOLEDRAFT_1141882 [Neolentinus lepideus HHB14362 ss-1]